MALGLGVHVEVTVSPGERLVLSTTGEGAEIARDANHPVVGIVRSVLGHDRVEIAVSSAVPLGRGLGSSAALALATAAAAGAEDPLAVAVAFDGHAENAAASLLGGLVTAAIVDGRPVIRRLELDSRLRFVVVIPQHRLATADARAALSDTVARTDAVANLQRMGLLIAGLANVDELVGAAGDDRLHQQARTPLFPESAPILEALRGAGALVACWSGAGPSLLAICADDNVASSVQGAGKAACRELGVPARVVPVEPDLEGLVVSAS